MSVSPDDLIQAIKTGENPIIISKIVYQLIKKEGISLTKLAQILNKKKSALSHLIRLNKLPDTIIDGYLAGIITLSHLYVISRLNDELSMFEIYEKVLRHNLKVAETEELVRQKKHQIVSQGNYFDIKRIEKLKEKLKKDKIDFKLIQSRIKTKVIMTLHGNLKEADKFLKKFCQSLEKNFLNGKEEDF